MATQLPKPPSMAFPFASLDSARNNIPALDQTASGGATLAQGFPPECSLPLSSGGVPPSRLDMNGMAYLATFPAYFLQQGGYYTYDYYVASAIGGYPQGAVLTYYDNAHKVVRKLRSTVGNNMHDFVTSPSVIGTYWEDVTPVVQTGRHYFDVFYSLCTSTPVGALPLDGREIYAADYPGFFERAEVEKQAGNIRVATEQEHMNEYLYWGQSGAFVFTYENGVLTKIRLPHVQKFIQAIDHGISSGGAEILPDVGSVGKTHPAGLPNITGTIPEVTKTDGETFTATGAFSLGDQATYGGAPMFNDYEGDSPHRVYNGHFNASGANPIYGTAETVQPASVEMALFIQVIEGDVSGSSGAAIDAGVVLDIVSGASYVTSSGASMIASSIVASAMPSGGGVSGAYLPISGGWTAVASSGGIVSGALVFDATHTTISANIALPEFNWGASSRPVVEQIWRSSYFNDVFYEANVMSYGPQASENLQWVISGALYPQPVVDLLDTATYDSTAVFASGSFIVNSLTADGSSASVESALSGNVTGPEWDGGWVNAWPYPASALTFSGISTASGSGMAIIYDPLNGAGDFASQYIAYPASDFALVATTSSFISGSYTSVASYTLRGKLNWDALISGGASDGMTIGPVAGGSTAFPGMATLGSGDIIDGALYGVKMSSGAVVSSSLLASHHVGKDSAFTHIYDGDAITGFDINSSGVDLLGSVTVNGAPIGGGTASGAIVSGAEFTTTVGPYTVALTSNGGLVVSGNGASMTFASGAIIASGASGVTVNDRPVLVELETVIDSETTSATIAVLSGGTSLVYTQPLTALDIGSITSDCRAEFDFTAASGAQIVLASGAGIKRLGVNSLDSGSHYLVAVNGARVVVNEYKIVGE